MIVIPAVDILGGKCVRLRQGDYSSPTVYVNDPVTAAVRWEKEGARLLHIVDLDGAKTGKIMNYNTIVKIAKNVNIPIQVGGGIRREEDIEQLLKTGTQRVVLSTGALEDKDYLKRLIEKYSDRIVVALDVKGSYLVKRGWIKKTMREVLTTAREFKKLGVERFIYTDTIKDGMMTAPDYSKIERLLMAVKVPIIVSGGISSAAHISTLRKLGVEGVIVGKALYEGVLIFKEINNVN